MEIRLLLPGLHADYLGSHDLVVWTGNSAGLAISELPAGTHKVGQACVCELPSCVTAMLALAPVHHI